MNEPPIEPLSRRERDVLALLSDLNLTNKDIAARLFLSVHSIKWYLRQIYTKLGVTNRHAALKQAHEMGLLGDIAKVALTCSSSLLSSADSNLPLKLTSFVGRQTEIDQILHLLEDPTVRLVTIVGVGGAGKTRLALKVAEILFARQKFTFQKAGSTGLASQNQKGIYWVELAGASEPAQVVEMVAAALSLSIIQDGPTLSIMIDWLHPRQALLVLDNCEHLIEASAQLVLMLLKSCPELQVLITSREILDIPGEQIFRLSPLPFPSNHAGLTLVQAVQSEAVQLFVERARIALPEFAITAENMGRIVKICHQLDGLPLALELAAARVRLMSLEQITERLERSLSTLASGGRAALPQHKTLRASTEWSFDLLSPAEQRLLVRLAVFRREWSFESAEAVCADDAAEDTLLPADAVLQTLCGLVDKSLVTQISTFGPQTRFRLLTSIRQFAHEMLERTEELALLQCRYLAYLLVLPVTDPDLNCLIEQLRGISCDWDSIVFKRSEQFIQCGLQLAQRAGIHGESLLHFRRGAVLSDIGKVMIPSGIINKAILNTEDWVCLRHHPEEGIGLLHFCPGFGPVLDMVASHHEGWDGSGYPRGLRGDEIPLAARVLAIVDTWDALRSDRPFRSPFSNEEARAILRAQAGKKLDPHLVALFLEIIGG